MKTLFQPVHSLKAVVPASSIAFKRRRRRWRRWGWEWGRDPQGRAPAYLLLALSWAATPAAGAAAGGKPYRLGAVDLKERIIWGVECPGPAGGGLAFGGQDQDAEDGRPHTRVRQGGGEWLAVGGELRAGNPLQAFSRAAWDLRGGVKDLRARLRHLYFEGRPAGEEGAVAAAEFAAWRVAAEGPIDTLARALAGFEGEAYAEGQAARAREYLDRAREAALGTGAGAGEADLRSLLRRLRQAQLQFELAAEALDAEPAARAVDCGQPRGGRETERGAGAVGLVFDPATGLYVLFGGDHLDYLTNDTWVFDPAVERWFQRHPAGAPPPRANHRLEVLGDGRVRLSGGYTYASNTDYLGGQYVDLDDGPWVYDIARDAWSGPGAAALVPADSRTYRTGPFHPDFYLQGDRPDAAAFGAVLAKLPPNRWVATDPPHRPRLNRDWGTAALAADRDLMLRWSGGHSAHGGTDVPHFHFATNRWELTFPVEFPLGLLYSNTSYPGGFNFNRRPWMTGHSYQNYNYDPASGLMVKAGRPRHFYLYDPGRGDWVGRGAKPGAMRYNSCFYTLTLVQTPRGIFCWDKNGRVHRYTHGGAGGPGAWTEVEIVGGKLPGAVVDNSTIAYDAARGRLLMVTKPYGRAPFDGQVWSLDLETRRAAALDPGGMEGAHRFAYIDRCVYLPGYDLLLLASYLDGAGTAVTPTPAYDCAANAWVTLGLDYATGKRGERTTRAFPHGRSCGILFDPERRLIWGTDTNSQVYVIRLEIASAARRPLE